MYTRQQISLIEDIKQSELFELEMNQLIDLLDEIEDESNYPYTISNNYLTSVVKSNFSKLSKVLHGMNMNEIAEHQNVKINTIEDHVLEIFIKVIRMITTLMSIKTN